MSYNATHRRNLSTPTTTTIQDISTHFSTLYVNHKAYSFSKPSYHPLPPTATHLQPQSTAVSTAVSLTKSQSQRNRGKPQEQEESIKKAIVNSNKEPIKNLEGCVNLMSDNQEKGGGSGNGNGEMRKLPQGYEVKKQSLSSIGMHRGRRRSFGCSSQVELADFLAFNGVKVVSADMPPFMQLHAVDVTRKTYDSLEKFTAKSLASTLKKEFDGVYGAAWHCIVGLSFGSFVTHSVGGFLYFSMDQKLFVLLFKTAVQRAP